MCYKLAFSSDALSRAQRSRRTKYYVFVVEFMNRRLDAALAKCLLLLRGSLLHVFELTKTRAENVVRHPAENRGEHEKDGDAAIDAGELTELFRSVGGFRHAHQSGSRETRTREHTLLLRGSLLHVFELTKTRAENVVRHPAENRGEHEKDGDAAIDAGRVPIS